MRNNKKRDEKGAIMLEALIVYPITLFLLFFVLCIFSVLFQRWNMQVIANETAMRIAQTYKLTEADILTGEISADDIVSVKPFRYFFGNKEELINSAKQKATQYAKNRLLATTYTKFVDGPDISLEVVSDALSRRHIEVTIKGEYSVPFGEALSYFGFGSTIKYETTGYADCIDIIDYINTTKYIKTQTNDLFGNAFGKAIDSVLSLFDNILN